MSNVKTSNVQVGQNATASQNFTLRTNADGTFRISRGAVGALLGDVLTVNADGSVTGNIIAGVGVGQTWQDVAGSRVLGVNYTNTTGKSLQLFVRMSSTAGAQAQITIDGVNLASVSELAGAAMVAPMAIVPVGAVYSAQVTAGTGTIATWRELS
jgi:hypothetical protein